MGAELEIRSAKRNWARAKRITFDWRGYVPEAGDNLHRPLSNPARLAYERGAGSELSGHMRALHSSSALADNLFDYWTERIKTPIVSALGIGPEAGNILDFETQLRTGL